MSSGASVSALQRLVEQLKLEAVVERMEVSQAAAELQQYCIQNACKDALLLGVPAGSNPFLEPRSCLYCEDWEATRGSLVRVVMDDCRQVPRKQTSRANHFSVAWSEVKILRKSMFCFVF